MAERVAGVLLQLFALQTVHFTLTHVSTYHWPIVWLRRISSN
jgi:hypothetical protein